MKRIPENQPAVLFLIFLSLQCGRVDSLHSQYTGACRHVMRPAIGTPAPRRRRYFAASSEDGSHKAPGRIRSGVSSLVSKIVKNGQQQQEQQQTSIDVVSSEALSLQQLQRENELLRNTIQQLSAENDHLRNLAGPPKIVLENFEGEWVNPRYSASVANNTLAESSHVTLTGEEMLLYDTAVVAADAGLWCDELEEGACPLEPTISFGQALRDRAIWLCGLLLFQSASGIILSRNEALLANHPVIIYFLTMLVGAGGNAGNQASVRVIRGLALGTLNENTQSQFLLRELKMACALSAILSVAGFCRAAAFRTPLAETIAVTAALALIVFSSICLGAILPLVLKRLGADPAHSSTTIQVVMDILGVVLAVVVSSLLLDSPLGAMIVSKLSGGV